MILSITNLTSSTVTTDLATIAPGHTVAVTLSAEQLYKAGAYLNALEVAGKISTSITDESVTANKFGNIVATDVAGIHKATITFDHATDAAIVAGAAVLMKTVTKSVVMPTGALLIGSELILSEVVDNATDNAQIGLKVGGTASEGIFASCDVTKAGIGVGFFKGAGVDAAVPFHSVSGQTINAVMTATEDVNTITKGNWTVNIFYTVPV